MIRTGCVWTWTQCEYPARPLSLCPPPPLWGHFPLFCLDPDCFFRSNFPYLSFPFSYFSLHICVGLFVAPCLPPLCHFPLLYLLSSVIFCLFGRLRLPHFHCLFVPSFPPRPLLSFHPSPSPSSFPVFPPPSPLLSPRAPLIIPLPRYWSTRPFHLTLCHFVLAVWPGRSHQAAVRPSVHGAHQDRPDARLQRCLHVGRRSCSYVEPHRGGWLFRSPLQHMSTIPSHLFFFNPVLLEGVSCNFRQNSYSFLIITLLIQNTQTWNTNSDVSCK